jgi:hypothetical protein
VNEEYRGWGKGLVFKIGENQKGPRQVPPILPGRLVLGLRSVALSDAAEELYSIRVLKPQKQALASPVPEVKQTQPSAPPCRTK